ncbi:MAG: 3-dehydroquinate synthase [Clostridia bacterium]|nr:3-dehydroquinate synthase [Clostridia bacterium]
MQTIHLSASKDYDIIVTRGKEDFSCVEGHLKGKKVAVITDKNVDKLHGNYFDFLKNRFKLHKIVIEAGEKEKNGQNFLYLINALAELGFTRRDSVITFGGGVIGDLGAFVASTYMRGISLVAVPTTLLSMVDSSVGGKTAIDIPAGKNLCGTFYQPDCVYVDLNFLNTLPEREISCGYGEIIKYVFISDKMKEKDLSSKNIEDIVAKAIEIKKDIVQKDEKESNLRKLLNFGHTVGHAIEKLSNYTLSHGECVVKGMRFSIDISAKLYDLDVDKVSKMKEILSVKGHDLTANYDVDELINVMKSDKKSGDDWVDFVTVKDIGEPVVERLSFDKLKEIMNER